MADESKSHEDNYVQTQNIILRNYQSILYEETKKGNRIIYSPTNSGKTLIAINLLCSKAVEIVRPFNEGGKRAFFVAATKVLVLQLLKTLSIHTKFNVVAVTGDMNVDSWNEDKWLLLLKKYHVLVLTGEILRQLLTLQIIKPANISLIVLDECHHAVANHPYSLILQEVNNVDISEAPTLLGLTSTLCNSNAKKENVLKVLMNLENLFRGKVISALQFEEVLSFASNPTEKLIAYKESIMTPVLESVFELYNNMCNIIGKMILKPLEPDYLPKEGIEFKNKNRGRRIINNLVISKDHFEELGLFSGSISALLCILFFEKFRLLSNDKREEQALIYARTELNKIRHIVLTEIGEEETKASIIKYSSPKFRQLMHTIKESKTAFGDHISIIIFVRRKMTAILLAFVLKRLSAADEEFSFIKADFMIGSSLSSKELLKYQSDETLNKFINGCLNVLVATQVLEEGLDVSACNVIISFDFPQHYTSYIQSRGRARYKDSFYYLFCKDLESSEKSYILKNFNTLHKEFNNAFTEGYDSVNKPQNELESIQISGKTKTITVDGIMAVKTIYRYCSLLPQDKYSLLSPIAWYLKKSSGFKQAFIQLPINCPLRHIIEGEDRPTAVSAKRNVFLNTLKLLYDINEIDDNLNVNLIESKLEKYEYLFPCFKEEKIEPHLPQPGTGKRNQVYKVKFADCLSNCLPEAGRKAYLHVIDLSIVFDKPTLERKIAIYELLKFPVTFGIISSKKLHRIFQFPLFLGMGQVNCDFLVNYDEIVFTESEIQDIKACHFALFHKVTRTVQNFQVFDSRNKEHSFFVAPVEKNADGRFVLSWDIIRCDFCRNNRGALVRYNPSADTCRNVHSLPPKKSKIWSSEGESTLKSVVPVDAVKAQLPWEISKDDENEKPKFTMNKTDYENFIVVPNYRNQDPPTRYIVSKVRDDLTPLSPFPRTEYTDFIDYYGFKYSIKITNSEQPLLKVSPLYNCSNFNKPKNRKDVRAKENHKEYEELLLPELCDVIPFDRKFYLKALLIPTALNRIYHVYCVEEFRKKIVSETELGLYELPENMTWEPLKVNILYGDEKEDGTTLTGELTTKVAYVMILNELCRERYNSILPLSQLKPRSNNFLDTERDIFEVSPCDMEFYVQSLRTVPCMEENLNRNENQEIIKLMNIPIDSAPSLKILEGLKEESGVDLALLVQASTAKSAHDLVNYERLEILGDCFLKFACTLFLFKNCQENEGVMTTLKSRLIGNRNLMYCGLAKNIQDVINVSDFVPTFEWNPPLLNVPEKLVDAIIESNVDPAVLYGFEFSLEEQFSGVLLESTLEKSEKIIEDFEKSFEMARNSYLPYKAIRDKTISDCVEAFIGAYLCKFGIRGAFKFLSWLEVLPKSDGLYQELMAEPYEPCLYSSENYVTVMDHLETILYTDLEDILNYRFKNKAFLLEALTHPSFNYNRITNCYQRLEFLGDALLDFLITAYIYENCGDLKPSEVTDIRSSLVNNTTFACFVVRYEFYKHLLAFSSPLKKAIEVFVAFQTERNHAVEDSVLILLETNDSLLGETIKVPKALGDLFESLAGAIFLDSGNSLETVWKVYYRLIKRELDDFIKNVPKTAVRLLYEICNEKPHFETKVVNGTTKVTCTVYYKNQEIKAYGLAESKREGKMCAAKLCLRKILQLKGD